MLAETRRGLHNGQRYDFLSNEAGRAAGEPRGTTRKIYVQYSVMTTVMPPKETRLKASSTTPMMSRISSSSTRKQSPSATHHDVPTNPRANSSYQVIVYFVHISSSHPCCNEVHTFLPSPQKSFASSLLPIQILKAIDSFLDSIGFLCFLSPYIKPSQPVAMHNAVLTDP